MSSGDRQRARQWRDFGRFIAIAFDAITSALFGYEFVRIVPTAAEIFGGLSVSGIVGGLVCLGLTAGMARIWNVTQLKAAESEAQHNIAQGAYFGSVAVSLLMTVIFILQLQSLAYAAE